MQSVAEMFTPAKFRVIPRKFPRNSANFVVTKLSVIPCRV